jgi:hypothetical protein
MPITFSEVSKEAGIRTTARARRVLAALVLAFAAAAASGIAVPAAGAAPSADAPPMAAPAQVPPIPTPDQLPRIELPPLPQVPGPAPSPPSDPTGTVGGGGGSGASGGGSGGGATAGGASTGDGSGGGSGSHAGRSRGAGGRDGGGGRGRAARARAADDSAPEAAGRASRPTGARRTASDPAASGGDPLSDLGRQLPFPRQVPDWSRPIILVLLLLLLVMWARAALARGRERRLGRDLRVLQGALVPSVPSGLPGVRVSVAYRPADGPAAGGDFYDLFPLADGRTGLVLGDASGHGRAALSRATAARYTVRAYMEAGLEPREALAVAGRVLGRNGGEEFTTAVAAVHDAAAETLTYARAGHPPPILTGSGAHEPVTACSSPALGWGVPTGLRQTTVPFHPGSLACFYTDGLTEARLEGGRQLTREGLAAEIERLGPDEGARQLLRRTDDTARLVTDDMAACVLRTAEPANGGGQTWRLEELRTDRDDIEGPCVERFLRACGVSGAALEEALESARAVVSEHEGALLLVRLTPDATAVDVVASIEVSAAELASGGRNLRPVLAG